jgi:hypothetical protein
MKFYIPIFLILLTSAHLTAQNNDTWYTYLNDDSTLFGFEDAEGNIKTAAKYDRFSTPSRFDEIVAVTEEIDSVWQSYYLCKSGKKVGRDSLHVYDFSYDCESEGLIRFRDKTTDKVGMFNGKGEIVIPAEYNGLQRAQNGMIIGLKGAIKEYWQHDQKHDGCNHFYWVLGKEVLIDTSNNTLIEDFPLDQNIDFFSLEKTSSPHPDTIRNSFLATDGMYYSFVDYEKEFMQWITNDLLVNLTPDKLIAASNDSIIFSAGGWITIDKQTFITANFEVLKTGLSELLNPECEFYISMDIGSPHMNKSAKLKKYYNNCGEFKSWIYPCLEIVISHRKNGGLSQNYYHFLRTDHGYKLINLTVRNATIKY